MTDWMPNVYQNYMVGLLTTHCCKVIFGPPCTSGNWDTVVPPGDKTNCFLTHFWHFITSQTAHRRVQRYLPVHVYIAWQGRNFVPYLCQMIIAAILQAILWKMLVTEILIQYPLLVNQWSYGHFLKLIQFYLNIPINLLHLTQHIMSYYTHKMAIVSWP